MKEYMVEFEKDEKMELDKKSITIEQTHFIDLMRQNLLQHVNISFGFSKFWLIFKVESRFELDQVIQTLPSCGRMNYKVHNLM